MMQALKGEPERAFLIPSNIRFETVDTVTGCPPKPVPDPDQNQNQDQIGQPLPVPPKIKIKTLTVAIKTGQTLCPKEDDEPLP